MPETTLWMDTTSVRAISSDRGRVTAVTNYPVQNRPMAILLPLWRCCHWAQTWVK